MNMAKDLCHQVFMLYNAENDGEWQHVAPYVIDDFRKSFEDVELRAISSAGPAKHS